MHRVLVVFRHSVAHGLTGQQPRKGRYGGWVYPPLENAMAKAGLQEVETYVYRHKNTVVKYIATRPTMDLCLAAKQRPGQRVTVR